VGRADVDAIKQKASATVITKSRKRKLTDEDLDLDKKELYSCAYPEHVSLYLPFSLARQRNQGLQFLQD